ncbi:HEPN domain-containing protein [Bacillus subtilis]
MSEFLELYEELKGHMESIYNKFLKKHNSNPLSTPEEYSEDVKAYCILAHAYLEEYVEEITAQVRDKSIELWFSKEQKITRPLLTLLSYSNQRLDLLAEKEKTPYQTIFTRLKTALESAKVQLSTEIHNNHGASEPYLRKLLGPVSIDISQEPKLMDSLSKLAKARGSYAHKNAKKTLSPEDAKKCVEDCLELSQDIERKAFIIFDTEENYKCIKKKLAINKLCISLKSLIMEKSIQEVNRSKKQESPCLKLSKV